MGFHHTTLKKLEQDKISCLFKKQNMSPTTDMLVKMLKNHRMRSTYDFEKAIDRELRRFLQEIGNGVSFKWNFRDLDRIAGERTTTSSIFELK